MKFPKAIVWAALRYVSDGAPAARALGVHVGDDCRIYSGSFGSGPWLVSIGDRVIVSFKVLFITHDATGALFRDHQGRRFRFARIRVGDDVFIGAGSIILPGVHIGDRSVVAAGSVVTKSVPSGAVVAGNPARIVSTYAALGDKVLSTWKSSTHRRGQTFRQHVDSLSDDGYRPELEWGKVRPLPRGGGSEA